MKQKKPQQHIHHKEHTQSMQTGDESKPDQSLPILTQDEAQSASVAIIDTSLVEDEQEIIESSDDNTDLLPSEDNIDIFDATRPPETPRIIAISGDGEAAEDGSIAEKNLAPTIIEASETQAVETARNDGEQHLVTMRTTSDDLFAQLLKKSSAVRLTRQAPVEKIGKVLAYILLAMIVLSSFMLWRATSMAHLYTTALDPHSGTVQARQELGSFSTSSMPTMPIHMQPSVLVGMPDTNTQDEQHVLTLQGDTTSWQVQKTIAVPFAPTSLSSASDGSLLIESADGMQVVSPTGKTRWHLHRPQPALGVHPFQPASDGQTVYTLLATQPSQVAAYNLQNGTQLWTHMLDDTAGYAAPLLLDNHTLYIASDHMLYALSSYDGSVRWSKNFPARTLLLEHEDQTQLLLAAGTDGLVGLDAFTGVNVWTFRGLPGNTVTPAQFYQASLGKPAHANHQIIYTTGIVWQIPLVQEQVWLYAIDAATGTPLWSQTLASGIVSADAGRFFMPILDASQAIIVQQQQIDGSTQRIEAFDANNGQKRWSQLFGGISHTAPSLLLTPAGSLLLFTTSSDLLTLLHTPTIVLAVLLTLTALSATCLLLLFLLTFPQRKRRLAEAVHALVRRTRSLLERLQKRLSRRLTRKLSRRQIVLVVLLSVMIISVPGYFWLSQPQARVYQIATSTGATQWQTSLNTSVTALGADAQGSIVVASEGANLHQLQALNNDGTIRWHLFTTEGTFFLPDVITQPGTLLVALSGHTTFSYQLAPDDPAYPRSLDHLLMLYLLDRSTGTPLWQHVEVYPDDQQSATILGSDTNYIYVASIQTNPLPDSTGPRVQLLGINQTSGTIDWRVFGPSLPDNEPHDNGKLFLRGNQAIWQVAGTVYAIDTTVGQIAWRRPLTTDPPELLAQEEDNMTQIANFLLVARSGSVHALDLASGNEIWTIASTGSGGISDTETPTKVAVAAQTVLLGKQAQLYAFNGLSRQLLWDQRLSGPIQQLRASDDGKTIYAMTAGQNNVSELLAIDTQTGAIRWHFTQGGPFAFFNADSDGFQYRAGHVLIGTCSPSQSTCDQQHLYVLDGTTGKTLWNITGSNLANIRISPDGMAVVFDITHSTWADLVAHFH